MKNQPFLYLTICLIIGILISDELNIELNFRIFFILIFFGLFFFQLLKNKTIQVLSIGLQTIILGVTIHQTYNNIDFDYYNEPHKNEVIILEVIENYLPNDKYLKYKAKNVVNNQIGMVNIPIQNQQIYPSDTLIVFGNIFPLNEITNPNQFNYKQFLQRKNITHSIYVTSVLKVKNNHNSWKKIIVKSKENIRIKLKKDGYNQETRAIISSMLLGDRTEISDEISNNYVTTGVIHILSISGLHVVMIYIILQFIFKPLLLLKNGQKLRIIISLITIWIFAVYVELQPPVFRSALMITIYYLSELLKRPKNIYHTLSLSAFIILYFQPNTLFDIGFQLSFSAVFFIVWLNPIYKKWYQPKYTVTKYFYELSTTSINAQLGTLPFSTLYFNQFSGLFLFGNIVLIPASFLMIIGAIVAIFLSIINLKITLYIKSFNWFITTCNSYLKWLSTFDIAVFKQIYISSFTAFLIVIILILIRPLFLKHSKFALTGIIICFIGIQINRTIDIYQIKNTNEFVVFNASRNTLIGIRNGQSAYFFTTEKLDSNSSKEYIIKPYLIRNRIKKTSYFPLDTVISNASFDKTKNVFYINNQSFFIGKNLNNIPLNLDYLLIRNSSFNPEKISNLYQLKRVITDGSNYPNYILKLDSLMNKKPDSILWITSKKGYFHIKF